MSMAKDVHDACDVSPHKCSRDESETPPPKKPRLDSSDFSDSSLNTDCVIFIVEKKISLGHLSHLKGVAKKKGFTLAPSLSEGVTHIVTTLPSYERLLSTMSSVFPSSDLPSNAEVISLECKQGNLTRRLALLWLTASFVEGKPIQVTDRYRLLKPQVNKRVTSSEPVKKDNVPFQIPEYECQRVTLLDHHNHILTDSLELLERYYQHLDHKTGDTRALAFRQASCALKVLPKQVTDIKEVANLHRIGKHSSQVIEDILSNGSSLEVEECKNSEWFKCMEMFTSVYGCGSATADKWYQKGFRSIKTIQMCKELQLTETQKLGLSYYDHLSVPVNRKETEFIVSYIQRQVDMCLPGTTVEAVGGFRRGKPHGHDVDLLLSHADGSAVDRILDSLLACLQRQNMLIHSDVSAGHNTATNVQHSHVSSPRYNVASTGRQRRAKFDHLDKAFCILSLPYAHQEVQGKDTVDCSRNETSGVEISDKKESPLRLIKRVDFIISPPEQYPFALVSWTGSKQFNRSIRRYSAKELNMSVTAHGVYDIGQQKYLPAATEKEVFALLKLEYREPWERNC